MDMCHSCHKSIESDPWYQVYEEPKNIEESMAIMKSKSQEIILCKECSGKMISDSNNLTTIQRLKIHLNENGKEYYESIQKQTKEK